LITQSQFGCNFKPKLTFAVAKVAAALAVVGTANRALVQFTARAADITVKNGVQGAALLIIGASHSVIHRLMTLRTLHQKTILIKLEPISAHHIFRYTSTINRCNKFYVFFNNFKR
jgi:hypothetical protein